MEAETPSPGISYQKKPWSNIWILLFSILGGPAAGFLLVWQNLIRLNRKDLAKKFFIYGIIALIGIEIGIVILISIGFAYVNNLGLFLSAIFPAYHELTYLHTWKKENPKVAGFSWSLIVWTFLGLAISILMILSIPFLIPKTNQNTPENSSNYSNLTPTPTPTKAFLQVQGKLTPINTDLNLLQIPKDVFPVTYYQAGTITSGLYKDYKRIIANYEQGFAGGSACISYTFITSDNTSYYLLGPFDREIFNASKVTKNIDDYSTVPETIELNTHSLKRYDYNTSYLEISSGESQCSLPTKTDTLLHLSSQGKTNYDYYASNDLNSTVVTGWTDVYIPDATGLLHIYSLFSPISSVNSKKDNFFSFDMGNYKFQHPESFYATYHVYDLWSPYDISPACGPDWEHPKYPEFSIDFSAIKPDDFIEVEKINSTAIFILKDSAASSIYASRYNKIKKYADSFNNKKLDPGDKPFVLPSYDDYVKKHPFVFIKDAFGRFILYEEGDSRAFHEKGGC